jgi:hypothetical protein
MDIIAKLALDEQAGSEIGRIHVITGRLMHAFFGREGLNNMHYDQSLRKVGVLKIARLYWRNQGMKISRILATCFQRMSIEMSQQVSC